MIRINLAPDVAEQTHRSVLGRDALITAVLCFAVFLAVEHYALKFDDKVIAVDMKLEEQKSMRARMQKNFEKAKQTQDRVEGIRSKGRKVLALGEGRKIPIVLLDNLQMRHPERMWFNKLTYSTVTGVVTLTGYALDHSVIADYLRRLKEMEKIDSSAIGELREFVPQQLLNSSLAVTASSPEASKNEIKALESVTLTSLKSEEVQGVTLQKFEITIKIQVG
ncbi:MAG: PilN domain-containing protein [Betaproteobacteria bacterium]|nr:PilN domain-containing protein [Betaproteobacteria bacterium]